LKRISLAVNKAFTTSCFDLEGDVGFDVPAATGWSPFTFTGHLTGGTYTMRIQSKRMAGIATASLFIIASIASIPARADTVGITYNFLVWK
jgi:hypothetical protein